MAQGDPEFSRIVLAVFSFSNILIFMPLGQAPAGRRNHLPHSFNPLQAADYIDVGEAASAVVWLA